jgi:hypothetical protein
VVPDVVGAAQHEARVQEINHRWEFLVSYHHVARAAATAGLAALLVFGGVSSASSRPDPGEPTWAVQAAPDDNCALRRIGAQLVRCDSLTGAGVRAPSSIPEFGTEGTELPAFCTPDRTN